MENNQSNNQNTNPANGERTFTQDEVNRIIGERLAKEKTKGDAAFAEREQQFAERERQLAKREALFNVRDKIASMGLPDALLDVLDVTKPEALDKALEALEKTIEEKTSLKGFKVIKENKLPESPFGYEHDNTRRVRDAIVRKHTDFE